MEQNKKMADEIEKLKQEIKLLESNLEDKKEIALLKGKLAKLKFREKHGKMISLTESAEQGVKRLFKGLGSDISKAGKSLEKSDEWINKKQKEEKLKSNKKSKSSWDDISLGID